MDVGLEKMAKRVPRILMSSESLPPPSPSFALTARFSVQIFYARAGAAGLRSNANTPQDLIKKGPLFKVCAPLGICSPLLSRLAYFSSRPHNNDGYRRMRETVSAEKPDFPSEPRQKLKSRLAGNRNSVSPPFSIRSFRILSASRRKQDLIQSSGNLYMTW